MRAGRSRLTLAITALAIVGSIDARAGSIVVIGNDIQASDGTLSAVASVGSYAKTVGFTMGDQSYGLATVTLRLQQQSGSHSTLSVELFGGTASGPSGSSLVDFNVPVIPTVAHNVTFTPTSSFLLQANATYWLEVSGNSDTLDGIVWYGSNPAMTPTGVATSDGALFSNQAMGSPVLRPSSVMNTFQITGLSQVITVVPEPRSLIPAGFGVFAGLLYAGWLRGRRRAR